MTGPELRTIRKSLSLTQAELAAALGVQMNTITRWECGRIAIQHGKMLRLALERLKIIKNNT